jgi:hypothetical protein
LRARNLKPGFFQNECLAELPIEARLLFAGLWCMADREGRLEDRPKRIKIQIFPGDMLDVEPLLRGLAEQKLIVRYQVDGTGYIWIPCFLKHQRPHSKEAESVIPAPEFHEEPKAPTRVGASTDLGRCEHALNPSSLNPESLNPLPTGERAAREPPPAGLDLEVWKRWEAYRREIRKPIKPASLLAAQRKLAGFGSDQAAVVEHSVANGYTGLWEPKRIGGTAKLTWTPPPDEHEAAHA